MTTHLVIPDTQSKPGTPSVHLKWIGRYILERKPDVVVHLGDHWDMPSLSSYDKGKRAMENRRYREDVDKGNADLALLTEPLHRYNIAQAKKGKPTYEPRLVLLRGNHEHRIERAVEDNAQLEGAIGFDDLLSPGWEVYPFLKPVFIDGVGYCHYWPNSMGRPLGGMIESRLKAIGHSFTAGHQQTLQTGIRFIQGPNGPVQQRGLVAGSAYLHHEEYLGFQGNAHWRGIIVKHEVCDGAYGLMEVSLDFLCRKYEGMSLHEYLTIHHPELT